MIEIDDDRHQLFGFPTEKKRADFLRDLTNKHPFLQYMSATDPDSRSFRYLLAIRIDEGDA